MPDIRLTASMAALALLTATAGARAEGDAAKGEKVFAKCKTCHEVATAKNKVGPTLHGVIGRKAGTAEGFKYSPAMAGSDGGMPGGCGHCGGDGGMPPSSCDLMCPSCVAVVPARVVLAVAAAPAADIRPVYPGVSRTEPPDPHPPRTASMS